MEIGSKEHKQVLKKGIHKVAIKTILMAAGLAVFLNIPSLLRENTFSNGLALTGLAILVIGVAYAFLVAFNKYRKVIFPFDEQHNK